MERKEHKQISLACVGSARSVWATLDLTPLTVWVPSRSTQLRLQVALPGNCLKQALGCMHFPGLTCSGSASQVLHKDTDSVGPESVPFPGPSSSGNQVFDEHALPMWRCVLSPPLPQPLGFLREQQEHHLRSAVCLLWGAGLWLRPS